MKNSGCNTYTNTMILTSTNDPNEGLKSGIASPGGKRLRSCTWGAMALIALCVTLLILLLITIFLYLGASDGMLNGTRCVAVRFLRLLHIYLIHSYVTTAFLLLLLLCPIN